MPEMRDPMEIYRESLAAIPLRTEQAPPTILRAEAWPYPELDRVWVRVQSTPFAEFPDLSLRILDPAGQVVSTLYVVEMREPYQSLTLHLRQAPRPGDEYRLEIELLREDQVLDVRTLTFPLAYTDPQAEKKKAAERGETEAN